MKLTEQILRQHVQNHGFPPDMVSNYNGETLVERLDARLAKYFPRDLVEEVYKSIEFENEAIEKGQL